MGNVFRLELTGRLIVLTIKQDRDSLSLSIRADHFGCVLARRLRFSNTDVHRNDVIPTTLND